MKEFNIEYAYYVVNPYNWARKATLNDIIWLEDIAKGENDIMKRKALEILNMVNRVRLAVC
jgi:hypothetical protein